MNTEIFVYGTLLENLVNYNKYLIGKVCTKKYGRVKGKLYHQVDKGYPAMIEGTDFVYGEVFEVVDWENTMKALDGLESYYGDHNPENEYNRVLVEVELLETGEQTKAFAYFYNGEEEQLSKDIYLPEGNWRTFIHSK